MNEGVLPVHNFLGVHISIVNISVDQEMGDYAYYYMAS